MDPETSDFHENFEFRPGNIPQALLGGENDKDEDRRL